MKLPAAVYLGIFACASRRMADDAGSLPPLPPPAVDPPRQRPELVVPQWFIRLEKDTPSNMAFERWLLVNDITNECKEVQREAPDGPPQVLQVAIGDR